MAKIIGLIPARAGSKGLVGKNLRLLNGKPLLSYSVEAAQLSGVLDEVIVSSDGGDILELAQKLGAICERRKPELAADDTPMDPVIKATIEGQKLSKDDHIVLLQPTSPLRTAKHIQEAYKWFVENDCDSLVSVRSLDNKILKASIQQGKFLEPIYGENTAYQRRQDLPSVFLPNGAIYIFSVANFLKADRIPRSRSVPYVMSAAESMDIDTDADLMRCSHYLMGLHSTSAGKDAIHG